MPYLAKNFLLRPLGYTETGGVVEKKIDILLVAGGGGGGGGRGASYEGCGGGAGGVIYKEGLHVESRSYSITIGLGGAGGLGSNTGYPGTVGKESVFDNILYALGGGAGGIDYVTNTLGINGSGGGVRRGETYRSNALQGQGNHGGITDTYAWGGAGGGAGAKGGDYIGRNGIPSANGGAGILSTISGQDLWVAGGGGTAATDAPTGGLGGSGVGGNGGRRTAGFPGAANTGSGGGGGSATGGCAGGNGADGICIVRYITGTMSATGGTISTYGIYTCHTFLVSGVFTVL